MTSPDHPLHRGGLAVAFLLLTLAFAGCASDDGPRGRPPAHPVKAPPPLLGSETFFDGRIFAELKVGAGVGFSGEGKGEADGRKGGSGGLSGLTGGGGGMRAGGGEGGGRGGRGGGRGNRSGETGEGGGFPSGAERAEGPHPAGSSLPPVMIHLQFTNRGREHLDVTVVDFLSPLGNFVIIPEKVALDPGQASEVEPMTSRLDEGLESVEVTLALHLPGHTERRTITLHATPPPATPAGPVSGPARP